jgi:hypothetical protein
MLFIFGIRLFGAGLFFVLLLFYMVLAVAGSAVIILVVRGSLMLNLMMIWLFGLLIAFLIVGIRARDKQKAAALLLERPPPRRQRPINFSRGAHRGYRH